MYTYIVIFHTDLWADVRGYPQFIAEEVDPGLFYFFVHLQFNTRSS